MNRGETWVRLVELGIVEGETPEGRWDFSGVKLNGVHLSEAKLSRAKFSGADLSKANLSRADLGRTDFWRTNLSGADLSEADLSEADLSRAKLSMADLHEANLSRANLSRADLSGTDLTGADLSNTDLGRADLGRAKLVEANLSRADLSEADLIEANLSRADLSQVYLSRANLWRVRLSGADLSGADLSGADLSRSDLSGARLCGANLSGADLSEADLTGADLTNALLVGVNLEKAKLNNCHIYGILPWDLRLQGAEQTDLIITPQGEPAVATDNVKIAQLIYLLLNSPEVNDVIESINTRVILIAGRFTAERRPLLDALRKELRQRHYTPVSLDLEGAEADDITETVSTLVPMARFVIADTTDVPGISAALMGMSACSPSVPVQPLLQGISADQGLLEGAKDYPWILPVCCYTEEFEALAEKIVPLLETKAEALKNG